MAAHRPLSERRIAENKMGRSKFPGKPSKIGNRKRVNLSSFSLPEDNDSSKAAEKIYLGLSHFNETFGDNEMVTPGPFHGFSSDDLEEAIAEARIQQKEAEIEMKKHGKNINLWQDFQKELLLINCSSMKTKNSEVNKRKLFDGGGSSKNTIDNSDNRPSSSYRSNLESPKRINRDAFAVAKKLVERAKSNIIENSKSNVEKKFILPRRSIHSSRVIIPNKKFLEENANKNGKFLRSCVNDVSKKPKVFENKSLSEELKIDVSEEKKKSKSNDSSPVKIQDDKNNKKSQESPKNTSSSGKIILREARLQLDNNLSLMEGPFSSPNASSLSPNSQLKVNLQSSPGTLVCGVCGSVRLNMRQKYGILCCESCQKLISKIKKMCNAQETVQLECNTGGLCQYWTVKSPDSIKCEACWLKMCLKNSKLPWKLRCKLSKMLPATMQVGTGFDSPILMKDISNKFVVGDNNMKDFKWFHEASTSTSTKTITNENQAESKDKPKTPESLNKKARSLRRKNLRTKKQSKFLKHNRKKKIIQIDKKRQIIDLKGPRVKHVCRSASIVLGQPLATFPSEPSPSKKQSNNSTDECKTCDELITTNENPITESQGTVVDKINNKDILETKSNDKKSNLIARNVSKNLQQKSKKKISSDNLISMDFWESYDPEEVCETGFGLIGSEDFTVRALCFLCGSSGQEKLIHCASCCEPYHEFCINDGQTKLQDTIWRFDWVCPRCTICSTCGKTSGQQLKCIKCDNSYHTECVNRVRGRLLHSPDRPWVCSACLRCKSCNRDDVSFFVGNLPLCKNCFDLRQLGNFCPLCQRCYEADDYSCKMMECGDCKRWVHAKCEGLSDERYQVLSNLPETVEYICRMCCNLPPAPWWKAVESALKIGYLGVLKALSKNRKACTMLKWSPRKQCRCQNENSEDEENKVKAAGITERKTSIEVIHHPTESLKLTLKIMKNDDNEGKVRKSSSCNSLSDSFDCQEDSQASELNYKPTMSSPLNPPSDSGIGSTDDELKPKDDDELAKGKVVPFLDEKSECFCFLEVDSYNSRSKPFSPNLLSIKKKVTTCEYSSLQQFHEDMESMIETTQSNELIEVYHQTIRDIFPWFDPDTGKVVNTPQKISQVASREATPNATPVKKSWIEECLIPKEKLYEQPIDYYYNDFTIEDTRICMLCKDIGDGAPSESGRLLYCGQNEWVHCNCALWSGEVFEEIDGSLQNVHSAINRGRSIRCPECNLKGASVGCCARNCAETYHFKCARKIGCVFMDDKTLYCPNHANESSGKLVQNEKEFEIRRPVYVELDKRKMKSVDSNRVKFAVGGLHIESLGKFINKLSDQKESIIPAGFQCSRWFWSCYEPWRIVRYHFTIRLLEAEEKEGIDLGVNLTIDHSKEQELVDLKLKQLKYFQKYNKFLEINEKTIEEKLAEKRKRVESPKLDVKRPKKDHKVVRKIFDQIDSNDENNLSDNQNTADLLPPDLEEAILKDLPNDILDGISMQDIFMDINKEDGNEIEEDIQCDKKEFWGNLSEAVDEFLLKSSKRSKSEVMPKKNTLKNHQRSCSLNWNCKMDQNNSNKWKRSSKLNVTVNLLDSQDRNQLQELKFTDVSLDIKARLNDTRLVQQEEGKENKCLPWHTRLQPRLLQVDGGVDSSSSGSEAGESPQRLIEERNLQSQGYFVNNAATTSYLPLPPDNYFSDSPLPQMDGVDDRNCEYDSFKISQLDGTVDSESEGSESHNDDFSLPTTNSTDEKPVTCKECHCTYRTKISYQRHLENCRNNLFLSSSSDEMSEEEKPNEINIPKVKTPVKTPVKTSPVIPKIEKESPKEKPKPRVYTKRKPVQKPPQIVNKNPQIPQILLQQQQQPAIIVQDCPPVVPTTYLDPNIQYVTTVEPPRPPLIAPQPLPVAFQLQSAPEPQYILPQNGIIIQQPQSAGTIIPQGPIVMANDPVVLGSQPMYEFIQDPQTGGMFLASHNQPVFYNMETIVHNTVMQTNQFISNVMATSSFSQSTQVFQTSKVEQVMNVPSNVIFVNQNSSITDKIITSNDIICLQPSVIPNQQTVQVQNPVIHTSQTFTEQKIVPSQINPLRCIRPSRKVITNVPVNNKPQPVTPQRPIVKSSPMMRPSVSKIQPKTYEKAVITPKSSTKQQTTPSRAIVDFINNFKSDDFQLPVVKNDETPKKTVEVLVNDVAVDVAVTKATTTPPSVKSELNITITTPLTAKPCITPVKSSPFHETVLKSPPVISVEKSIEKPKIISEKLIEKPKISYDMPSLDDYDDSPPPLSIIIPPKVQTPPPILTSPQFEKKVEILPLKENSQVINSPKMLKVNNKTSPDEKLSVKIPDSDQNILAKSITISPRLVENLDKEENILENDKIDSKTEGSKLIIDAKSDDGFILSSFTITELYAGICNGVAKMRIPLKMPVSPVARKGHEFLGMANHGLQFLLEQLTGADSTIIYKHKYFQKQSDDKDEAELPIKLNPSGCARSEIFSTRKEFDIFAWLASVHRTMPKPRISEEACRRANNLPIAMQYRHLKETYKEFVRVYKSKIHGRGLFCLREIEAGEMVIEYAGELIRSNVTDKREKYYTDKGIGCCYMFRIDDHFVVDATMKGNAARFINHSCEPNCFSRVVDIRGKKHILIYALRKINVMEELTYDYKFPFEDDKISCHCTSKKCRKYLN